ncbi:MAG: transposase [Saprospiraceae bacterium]|jgi:putative transposase|nr:transposase [Saprospiraceae bacterium]
MSRYKILDQHGLNFLTLTVVDWVDVFIRKRYKDIIVESLQYCQKEKGLVVYAYVIMSSHLHLIAEAKGSIPLSDILRDFKKFTAKTILNEIQTSGKESRKEWMLHRFAYRGHNAPGNRQYQFWQNDNHPIILYTMPVIAQKIDYIHNNPVLEGWVSQSDHYSYSSATNYAQGVGLLDVAVVDLPMSWVGYVPGT